MRREAAYGHSRRCARNVGASGGADALLDALASTPSGLYCLSARLRTAYTGPLFRVRRSIDSVEADIGYVDGTNLTDFVALEDHCVGDNGFVVTIYDQSGNARNVTMATTTKQPKCYDSVSGAVLINTRMSATYDTGATADELQRADALGMSGATAISVWSVWTTVGTGAVQSGEFSIGAVAAGTLFEQYTNAVDTQIAVSIGGSRRNFTVPDVNNQTNNTIARLAAGAQIGASTLMHNAVECSEASSANPTNTLNLGTTYTDVVSGTRRGIPLNGKLSVLGFWASNLSAADLAVLNAASLSLFGV